MKIRKILILSMASILIMAFPLTAFAATNSYPDATSTKTHSSPLSNSGSISTISPTNTSASNSPAISSSSQIIAQKLQRDIAYIDFAHSYLLVSKDFPIKVEAVIAGWLPDPCHILQVSLSSASVNNSIYIDVYSLYDPNQICITVLQPFKTSILLGSFQKGQFTVLVNGVLLGKFSVIVPTTSSAVATKSTSFSTKTLPIPVSVK
jgi:hypothetical protein